MNSLRSFKAFKSGILEYEPENLKVRKQYSVYFQDELKVFNDVDTSLCRTRRKQEVRPLLNFVL